VPLFYAQLTTKFSKYRLSRIINNEILASIIFWYIIKNIVLASIVYLQSMHLTFFFLPSGKPPRRKKWALWALWALWAQKMGPLGTIFFFPPMSGYVRISGHILIFVFTVTFFNGRIWVGFLKEKCFSRWATSIVFFCFLIWQIL